jgi:quinol monooxygenase YgiN
VSKIAMIIRGRTQPGKRDEVRALYEQHLAPRALANDAQEVVVWCADTNDADAFYLFELYGSAEAMQANAQAPWFWEYLQAVGPLLAGQPEVVTATPAWSKGVGDPAA